MSNREFPRSVKRIEAYALSAGGGGKSACPYASAAAATYSNPNLLPRGLSPRERRR